MSFSEALIKALKNFASAVPIIISVLLIASLIEGVVIERI